MTSQVNALEKTNVSDNAKDCRRPANVPKEYCQKLKNGLARLEAAIRQQYEETFPKGGDWIARALREAREAAWETPFPSLFFPALAHLRVNETMPTA